MRARNIKPGLFKNELLGTADPLLTLLFEGLWCLADREGRLEDRPMRIKAEVFPYRENLDVHRYLTELERFGFVRRYKVGDLALIEVLNFKKHQSPHHTEKTGDLPAPVNSPLSNGEYPPDSLIPDSLIPDSKENPSSEQKACSDQVAASTQRKGTPPSQDACNLAALLKSEILRNKPDYRITPAQTRKWELTADRMLRIDGRTSEQIAELIRWVQRDEFWMANVLSMDTLREKFDQLTMKADLKGSTRDKAAPVKLPADYLSASERIRQERDAQAGNAQ